MKKLDCKTCFRLWLSSFAIAVVFFRIYAFIKAESYTANALYAVTDNLWCMLTMFILTALWWLPLAIKTYKKTNAESKRMRIILKIIILWLIIGLLVAPFVLIRYL